MKIDSVYSDYDFFANIYSKHWGNYFKNLYPLLKNEILISLSRNDRILDLCCGTGQLVNQLKQDGFNVMGLDGSKEMLKVARKKNDENIKFIQSDIREFNLKNQFKLVTCIYDSLNHLMLSGELEIVFRNVFISLKNEGVFMFDMNMEKTFSNYWNKSFNINEEGYSMAVKSSFSPVDKVGEMQFTIFSKDKQEIISQNVIKEKCYEKKEILSKLSLVGFVECNEIEYNSGRTVFIAKKI